MASMALNAIREAVSAIGVALGNTGVMAQDIGNNILVNLTALVDASAGINNRLENTENNMNAINVMVSNEIRNLNDKVAFLQGAVEANKGSGHRKQGILESKSVQGIKALGSDKGGFRMWNEKLINIITQIRPGSRKLFTAMAEHVDRDNDIDEKLFLARFEDSDE